MVNRFVKGCLSAALVPMFAVAPVVGGPARPAQAQSSPSCPWVTSSGSIAGRVDMLLSHMSVSQMDDLVFGSGSDLSTDGKGYRGLVPGIPSLCIPPLTLEDGPDGVGDGLTGVTQLPAAVSAAATWDPSAIQQYGAVVGSEDYGKGVDVGLGPTVNIVRDPRWGRAFESYGEDPYLTGQSAASYIRGVQSQGVMAMVKHWAVYNQETDRNGVLDNAVVSPRAMQEIYFPAFQSAVQQGGAAAVMCAYSIVDDQYSCQNNYLGGVMDREFGFSGFITSDWGATHSTAASALAGLDLQMPNGTYFSTPLIYAIQSGQVPVSQLRDMVARILTEMFRFGLFTNPPSGSLDEQVTTPDHVAVAQSVAEEGTVLLRNQGGVLPLSPAITSIAVIGADGTTAPVSSGGGSAAVTASSIVSPLQAITARAGPAVNVVSYSGTDPSQAAASASQAQVAVVFAADDESEGSDLTNVDLPDGQNQVISAVAAANPHTVVVLNTGSGVTMPWLDQVGAVLEAWYPGQQDGDAIAAILFGDANPSGKLPVTFPQSLAQVPASTPAEWPGADGRVDYSEGIDVGYRWYDAKNLTPLFPFGYGLSYTTFAYSHLSISAAPATDEATVTAEVTNTGSRAGADVAQLYVGDPQVSGEPPRQLKGFERVFLQPGQTAAVRFELSSRDLAYWSDGTGNWQVPAGTYQLYVGDSSARGDLPLTGSFTYTPGYLLAGADGGVFSFETPYRGSLGGVHLTQPIVGMASDPATSGYWLVGADGGVFAIDARYHGSLGAVHLDQPIVGMATDPATGGYWLVGADGGVFAFDAPYYGSLGGVHLTQRVVGIAAAPDGSGYWLVGADGGVFSFGSGSRYHGSLGGVHLDQPIVGMAPDPATGGYWLVGADGGVFAFDAPYHGSLGGRGVQQRIVAIIGDAASGGYWLVGGQGGVFAFGAPNYGSVESAHLAKPIVAAAAVPAEPAP